MCTRSAASRLESGSSNRNTFGLAHDGAADRDALALAAGELPGQAVEQVVDPQDVRGPRDLALDLRAAGAAPCFSPKAMFS